MINDLRGAPILMGARGDRRFDVEAVVEAILRVGQLLRLATRRTRTYPVVW